MQRWSMTESRCERGESDGDGIGVRPRQVLEALAPLAECGMGWVQLKARGDAEGGCGDSKV
jgi:hypothetical protein